MFRMNDLTDDNIFKEMGFNRKWIESGIVDVNNFLEVKKHYLSNREQNSCTEHYRWAAFHSFFRKSCSIDAQIFHILYDLGQTDIDRAMGYAIMYDVVGHPDCPLEIIEKAIEDDYFPLSRHALRCKNTKTQE
jgi:hypothetical protein